MAANNTFFKTAGASGWVAPANVAGNVVTVSCWGASGAGGGNNGTRPGGGGGGGAFAQGNVTIVSGNNYAYTVGAAGQNASNAAGTAGGNSFFNNNTSGNTTTMVRGAGGQGGAHATNTTGPGGTVANCIALQGSQTKWKGGEGSQNATTGSGGGGGGEAGDLGAGGDSVASITAGVAGANSYGTPGPGGNGGVTTAKGTQSVGPVPMGGGGGSGNLSVGGSQFGGEASAGQVWIDWWDLDRPTVTSQAVTAIAPTTATANGNITATGGAWLENDNERGVVYSTTTHADPGNVAPASTAYEFVQNETGGSFATGAFTESLTGLTPATVYKLRAYAHSRAGYDYSNTEQSFTTGHAYSLTANPGSGALTGTAATLEVGRVLGATAGSFTESGTAATLWRSRILTAAGATSALAGTAATLEVGRVLGAAAGSFVEAGSAATLTVGRVLSAEAGSFALAGTAATLQHGAVLVADPGSFALAGSAAALLVGRRLDASGATVALDGSAAGLLVGTRVSAAPGAFALVGTDADLIYTPSGAVVLAAEAGTFALDGTAATLRADRQLAAEAGVGLLTGTSAGLRVARVLAADAGAFAWTGTAATLETGRTLGADAGGFALAGSSAGLRADRRLAAEAGAFVLTGGPVAGAAITGTAALTAPLATLAGIGRTGVSGPGGGWIAAWEAPRAARVRLAGAGRVTAGSARLALAGREHFRGHGALVGVGGGGPKLEGLVLPPRPAPRRDVVLWPLPVAAGGRLTARPGQLGGTGRTSYTWTDDEWLGLVETADVLLGLP